ncbi:hypothetical protein E8P82_09230 [Arthrobacter echini]|uniref:DUF7882 domain-containing protein n=1 Tax=Arthrobacter echini TaxID=1529066 RepID=A0A4V6S861_9MICC|nr:hypothetical protein [Arthrobacter echini]THJ66179.1 hypothetical protein E8P82_09230 [Arthrobacter echini]
MGTIRIGGYQDDLVFTMPDNLTRSMQAVIIMTFRAGRGLFLRSSGAVDGRSAAMNVWLAPSQPVRFEYEADEVPEPHAGLTKVLLKSVDALGGVILPTQGDLDRAAAGPEESDG